MSTLLRTHLLGGAAVAVTLTMFLVSPVSADHQPEISVPNPEGTGGAEISGSDAVTTDVDQLAQRLIDEARLGDLPAVVATLEQLAQVKGGPTAGPGSGAVDGGPRPFGPGDAPGMPGGRPEGPTGTGDDRTGDHGGMLEDHDCWGERARSGVAGDGPDYDHRGSNHWDEVYNDTVKGTTMIIRRFDGGNMHVFHVTHFDNGDVARVDGVLFSNEQYDDDVRLGVHSFTWQADPEDHSEGAITSRFDGQDPSDSTEPETRRASASDIGRAVWPEGDPREEPEKDEPDAEETTAENPAEETGSKLTGPDGAPDPGCDETDRPTGHEGDEPGSAAEITTGPGAMPGDDPTVGDDRLSLPTEDWTWVIELIDPTINPPT